MGTYGGESRPDLHRCSMFLPFVRDDVGRVGGEVGSDEDPSVGEDGYLDLETIEAVSAHESEREGEGKTKSTRHDE